MVKTDPQNIKWGLKCTFILSFTVFVSPVLFCSNQADCNKKGALCSICVDADKNDDTRHTCIFPFPFFREDNKCPLDTHCENDCNHNGVCYKKRDLAVCECRVGYYGDTCMHPTPSHLTRVIPRTVDYGIVTIVNVYDYNPQHLWLSCESKGSSTKFYAELATSFGYFESQEKDSSRCVNWDSNDGRDAFLQIQLKVRFPFRNVYDISSKGIQGAVLNKRAVGYLTSYEVQLKVNEITVSKRTIGVFVSYHFLFREEYEIDLTCVPVISISNCASSRKVMTEYARSSEISITSSYQYIPDGHLDSPCENCCKDKATGKDIQPHFYWRLWRNSDSDNDSPTLEVFGQKDLEFNPFHLTDGTYRVLLSLTGPETSTHNFAYCYFRIRLEPLVAVMEGGTVRTIALVNGIGLDARRSKNPNQPHDNQTSLYATWNCVRTSDKSQEDICKNKTLSVSEIYTVPPEKLALEEAYSIKLTLWTNLYGLNIVPPVTVNATVIVSNDSVEIECLLNCEGLVITTEPLLLRVKAVTKDNTINTSNSLYEWTFREPGDTEEKDISLIGKAVKGTQNSMLMVRKTALDYEKSYIIKVRSLRSNVTAQYFIETEAKMDINVNCSIDPSSGVRGITLFDIVCQDFNTSKFSLTFEFYDKNSEEADIDIIFSGRMMGTSSTGKLEGVLLTRGEVFVYILSDKMLLMTKRFHISLSQYDVTQVSIDEMLKSLTQKFEMGLEGEVMRYTSAFADIIPDTFDKSIVFEKLLSIITKFSANNLASVKLTTSTLHNVLVSLNKPEKLVINPELLRDTLRVIHQKTKMFRNTVGLAQSLQGMTPIEIKEVAKYQLNNIHEALSCRDPKTESVNEFDFEVKTLYALMESSNIIEDTIYLLKDILTFLQAPGQPPTRIESTNNVTVLWVVKNSKDYKLTRYLNGNSHEGIPVNISENSLRQFEKLADENKGHLVLRVATIADDIFWWRLSDVKSNFVSLSPVIQLKRPIIKKIKSLKSTLSLLVNLKPSIKSTKVSGVSPKLGTEEETNKNKPIQVHRLDPAPRSILTLKFLYPPTNGTLRVLVTNRIRPTYDLLNGREAQIIKQENSSYFFRSSKVFVQEKESFLYIGILPQNVTQEKVSYTFEVNTTLCQKWVRGQWSSLGCTKTYKNDLEVICVCDHFSIFAAAFLVPPQEIDLFSDIDLFLTVPNNPFVVSFVIVVLVTYFILSAWAWRKDKVDRKSRFVNVLDDNFPGDHYPYLLAVYTSSRFNAGTTAHVGIKLIGDTEQSRAHILSSSDRKVLKRNCDDWFLIFCPQHLGRLQSILIWHDNAGFHSDWCLSKITVYDLTKNVQYIFIFEEWLALQAKEYPEATIMPATVVQAKSVKRMFLENCVLGLREGNGFFAIFVRHSRSEISRLQRVSIYMCLLMLAMLCSIMFYYPAVDGVDDSHYELKKKDVYVAIQSILITLVITSLVLLAFKRSNKHRSVDVKVKSSVHFKESSYTIESGRSDTLVSQNTTQDKCARLFTKTLKERPLVPAQLPRSEPVIIVRKKWLVLAWVSCFTIISLCSFLVMLYGLKLGKVQSKKWLTMVFLMVGEDVLIVGPVKIISIAAILSVILHKVCDEDTHSVTAKRAKQIMLPDNEEHIIKLLKKRCQPMYCPLSTNVKGEMMRKKSIKDNWWALIDFSISVMFVGVVSTLVFRLWSSHYYSNSHIANSMTKYHPTDLESQEFFDIKYIDQMDNYLKNPFILALYNTFWYNRMTLKSKNNKTYFFEDFIHVTVGLQKMRQFRVLPKPCDLKYLKTEKKCIPYLSSSSEAIDLFSTQWQQAEYLDVQKENWPWKYEEKVKSCWYTMYRLFGASGRIYGDGGYVVLLGPMKDNIQLTMLELTEQNWQDLLTKAVILELTLYNVNIELFSQVTMIVEYLLAGKIQLKIQVTSVESELKWELWNGLFFLFMLYYFIKSAISINRMGLMEYLGLYRNRSQLIIVILGLICIVIAVTHRYKSTLYYDQFIHNGKLTYFDFDTFVFYFLMLQGFLSILLAFAMFQTISLFRVGRSLLNHFYTLYITSVLVTWLILVTTLFLLIQLHLFILLNIFSMCSINEMLLDPKSFKYFLDEDLGKRRVRVLLFIKVVLISVVAGMFVMVFKHHTRVAKTYKIKLSDNFNIIKFFLKYLRYKSLNN